MVAHSAVATAAPTYLAMLETPDAPPTCSWGTEAVAAEEAGPFDIPMPTAIARIGSRNVAYAQEDWVKPIAANPAAIRMKPTPMTCRPPILLASFGTNGATTTSPTVAGSVAIPASSGLKSRAAGFWKYRLSRYIRPLMVPAPIRIARVEPTRIRLRSRARSSSGTATRFSVMTKRKPATTEAAKQPSVAAESHPQSPLLVKP